jgi:hypothetical protein
MHALVDYPELRSVPGLQEATVVAMADGYARASGELVVCNVHVSPGLGKALTVTGEFDWPYNIKADAQLRLNRLARALRHAPETRERFDVRPLPTPLWSASAYRPRRSANPDEPRMHRRP